MKITDTMTREERRDAIRTTTANRDHLIAIHQASSSPAETVAELIGRIGYQAARETIAEAVNARGDWDERISDRSRAWAATIDTAADRDTLRAHYLTSDAIHPAHVDQIARAAAEYDAEKPETASVYDHRRLAWFMRDAIARDAQGVALNVCITTHEAHDRKRIDGSQWRQIIALYDAWERGWVAMEAAQGAEAAEAAPAEAETDAEPLRAFERAGVISDLTIEPMTDAQVAEACAALEAAEEEPAEEPQPTSYLRADGDEATHSAAEALSWHRAGHDVIVARYGKDPVYLHGAPQNAAREEDENRAHCRRISDELDAYVSGEFKRCPDCGEIHRRDWGDVGDAFRCPNCGQVASVDDWEWLWVHDFLGDALDIEYIVDSRREFRSCRVMVAYGGPTIYIDTDTGNVELYWWSERARYALSRYALDAVNEWAEELWKM